MPTPQPIQHPSAWLAPAMVDDPQWRITFSAVQQAEVRAALAGAKARGDGLADITAHNFPLPECGRMLREVGRILREGRGFVLLRGFPIDGVTVQDAELVYCGLCVHLGLPLSQNGRSEFFSHITDKGPRSTALARGYATTGESRFHIDLTDVVGLLCLRQAKAGGISRIASSISILNAVMRERPHWLPMLREGFPWDRRDEHGPDEAPIGPRIPIFSEQDGVWACRYNRSFIEAAFRRRGLPIPEQASEVFDFLEEAAMRPEHVLEMDFRPGDIQFLSNDTVLHARTEFADHPEQDRKRLLLRAWLQMSPARPLAHPEIQRRALVRYGKLGRTMHETITSPNGAAQV